MCDDMISVHSEEVSVNKMHATPWLYVAYMATLKAVGNTIWGESSKFYFASWNKFHADFY